jgi:hypothetical protein
MYVCMYVCVCVCVCVYVCVYAYLYVCVLCTHIRKDTFDVQISRIRWKCRIQLGKLEILVHFKLPVAVEKKSRLLLCKNVYAKTRTRLCYFTSARLWSGTG